MCTFQLEIGLAGIAVKGLKAIFSLQAESPQTTDNSHPAPDRTGGGTFDEDSTQYQTAFLGIDFRGSNFLTSVVLLF